MQIDKYKLSIRGFTTELDGEIDRSVRSLVTTEVEIFDVSTPDNNDGTYDQVYKAKVIGQTIVKQSEDKIAVGKSKRRTSQKLRQRCWQNQPDDWYYENVTNGVIVHLDEVVDLLIRKGWKIYE